MADDLGDEWWKESEDDVEEPLDEDSGKLSEKKQRGVKRPAPSAAPEGDIETSSPAKKKVAGGKQKSEKKKKKKSRGKFIRKKITGEDDEVLKKCGTPTDVNALLQPSVVRNKSDGSASESDDNSDGEHSLSTATDFFPANEYLSSGEYLGEVLPGWQVAAGKAKLSPGSPLILILCSSAIRAVQLNREIKSFLGKDCRTAKLFAKHMKLEEQQKFLQKKTCHAAIGTPNRVHALLEAGCLKLGHLHAVVLDWNWRDVKLKRMADIPDVQRDLSVLLKEYALDHIKKTPCRIAIL